MADPLTGLETDLEAQRQYLAEQVPAYERLLAMLPKALDGVPRERLTSAWAGREFGAFYERPLLLLGALRDEALRDGPDHPLWDGIGAGDPDPEAISSRAIAAALERERLWELLATRYVQTNETSRAVAWLWPAALLARDAPGLAIELYDIGASAGLNLAADGLGPVWVDAGGEPIPTSPLAPISSRVGFDLRPLDVLDPDTERWLRACVWPGQRERLARLEQAIAAFGELAARGAKPELRALGAAEIPAALPGNGGVFCLAYQTVVRDYLGEAERAAFETGMLAWLGDRAGAAWVQLELEAGTDVPRPFGLTVRVAGAADDPIMLARCDPHPRALLVDEDEVGRFLKAVA